MQPATLAVLAGRGCETGEPLNRPPVFASAFRAGGEHDYARAANPTWEAFEEALGALDGGVAVAFGSGMAAAAATLDLVRPGGRVVAAASAYFEVRRLLEDRENSGRLTTTYVDPLDTAALLAAAEGADLVWLDALANPGLDVPDVDLIAAGLRRGETKLVVDATLVTPILMRPLQLGADVVIHSATKFIGGHSDLLLGAAVARDRGLAERLRSGRTMAGTVPGTMDTWLGLRGIRTLALRIERGSRTARELAEHLVRHPAVRAVRYPGLAGDPAHVPMQRLMSSFGAVLAFELDRAAHADSVCARVQVITHATSLGGVETLIERPGRWHPGAVVAPGLLRISVGCEDPGDLWRDLERALAAA